MALLRTWYLLVRSSWRQTVASLLLLVFVFLFCPVAWTNAERLAAKKNYLAGLAARLCDPAFWEKTLLGLAAFAVLQAVSRLFVYSFSLWAGSLGHKRQ